MMTGQKFKIAIVLICICCLGGMLAATEPPKLRDVPKLKEAPELKEPANVFLAGSMFKIADELEAVEKPAGEWVTEYQQVCENGVCRMVPRQVWKPAAQVQSLKSVDCTCENCTCGQVSTVDSMPVETVMYSKPLMSQEMVTYSQPVRSGRAFLWFPRWRQFKQQQAALRANSGLLFPNAWWNRR